jgi:hypothetical protein
MSVAGVIYVGLLARVGLSDSSGAIFCASFAAVVATIVHNSIAPGASLGLDKTQRSRRRIGAAVVVVAFAAAALTSWYLTAPPLLSNEEQELIEAAIAQSPDVSEEKEHVVDYRRFSGLPFNEPERAKKIAEFRRMEDRDSTVHDALDEFIAKNSGEPANLRFPHPLQPNAKLLAPWIRLRCGLRNWDHYAAILEYYPKASGLIELSPAGFSRDGMTAIIGLSHYSSGMSGAGSIFVYRRVNGKWVIQRDLWLASWLS